MTKVYWGGDLFDFKHLLGNRLLTHNLEYLAEGRYEIYLPQDFEQPDLRSVAIRDQDLCNLMQCNAAVFNFDGTDLDSGTVVEFMFAKFLDIPCVLLRTDFRSAGDGLPDSDPWNLMVSGWPRSKTLVIHSLVEYAPFIGKPLNGYANAIAVKVIEALDEVIKTDSVFSNAYRRGRYLEAALMSGSSFLYAWVCKNI